MFAPITVLANFASEALLILASPTESRAVTAVQGQSHGRFYDVQVCAAQIASSMRLRTHHSPHCASYRPTEVVVETLSRTLCRALHGEIPSNKLVVDANVERARHGQGSH